MNHKKRNIILFIFLSLLFIGCERKLDFDTFNCNDCYQEASEYGPLKIFFTINDENPFVLYTIYIGNFEERVIEYADTAFYPEIEIDVPVNQYYSVEAIYKKEALNIHAIDGSKLKQRKNTGDCDKECYYFKGGLIDVRLKQ